MTSAPIVTSVPALIMKLSDGTGSRMKQELSKEKAKYTVNQVQYAVSSVFKQEDEEPPEDLLVKMKRLLLTEKSVPPKPKK